MMKHARISVTRACAVLLLALAAISTLASADDAGPGSPGHALPAGQDRGAADGGAPGLPGRQPPFAFERNVGQTDGQVEFLARGAGYRLFLTRQEAVLSLHRTEPRAAGEPGIPGSSSGCGGAAETLRLSAVGARPTGITGVGELPGTTNYFVGRDPAAWRTGVARFAGVRYESVYPGIDLVYYGNHGRLEYDFIVAPGADPRRIRLRFEGARSVRVNDEGGLTVAMHGGEVLQHAPVLYQEREGARETVAGGYVFLDGGEVGFEVGAYDESRPLVIDPIIVWATYIGGSALDVLHEMKVDATGHVYVAGRTLSTNFPTTAGAFDQTFNPSHEDAFVAKLAPDGTSLVYATYIGGTGFNQANQAGDSCFGLDIDAAGSAYITGVTCSLDFPVTPGAYQTAFGGFWSDAYVVKLSPDGSSLAYSTYLGRNGEDVGVAIAVDDAGQAHVGVRTTTTQSGGPQWPTTPGAVDETLNGDWDAAIAKLSADGSTLLWSSFLGGSSEDHPHQITVDAVGDVYVVGRTRSTNFPTTAGAYQTVKAGTSTTHDIFASKISQDGTTLIYSTYIGGPGNDLESRSRPLVDGSGNLYLTGSTTGGFPVTAGALQTTFGGGANDALLVVLSADGTSLLYATYLGGSGGDGGTNVVFDAAGNLWWAGSTASPDFPTTPGGLPHAGGSDGFVVQLDPLLATMLFSTHVGGSGTDGAMVGLDGLGAVYVAGSTTSSDIPTSASAFQTVFAGGSHDLYVMKLQHNELPVADAGPDQEIVLIGTLVQLDGTASLDPEDGDVTDYAWSFVSVPAGSAAALDDPASATPTFVADVRGDYVVQLVVTDSLGAASAPDTVTVSFDNLPPVADAGQNQAVPVGEPVYLDGTGSSDPNGDALTYHWSLVTLPALSTAELGDPEAPMPTFTPDVPGTYVAQLIVDDGDLSSEPATVTIVATLYEDVLGDALLQLLDAINALDDGDFRNANMRNALTHKVNEVIAMIDEGRFEEALGKLRNDILPKTNGYAEGGAPDKNDWIRTQEGQEVVHPLVLDLIERVAALV